MKTIFSFILFSVGVASCHTPKNTTSCKGEPQLNCVCTKEYLPVCGCDGKTYSNACEAKCAGVQTWTEGACSK